ncbi:hypothetical protein PYCCODRAFT_1007877 [Trametes coccinea BRFM310]|uniref:Uncharacterized protein n=1 Tax=Trametes coccinea (strain BRFM310) TaxID=1353009 RepID=A0A1Y2ID96_TRAC3|nr:hypothetical protein PYCCODRAFT_1007877 [Trametes coccinea BRFM310]
MNCMPLRCSLAFVLSLYAVGLSLWLLTSIVVPLLFSNSARVLLDVHSCYVRRAPSLTVHGHLSSRGSPRRHALCSIFSLGMLGASTVRQINYDQSTVLPDTSTMLLRTYACSRTSHLATFDSALGALGSGTAPCELWLIFVLRISNYGR